MGFTRWPLTFCSQQDGVVINCWSLRAWTLLGPHFKRALRLCLLAESSVADRPGYGPISSSTQAHLEGSTLAENETLCLLMFSHDIFINAQSIHPYTSVIFLLSRSHREDLMQNICSVFRIMPSAAVLLSSLPDEGACQLVCISNQDQRISISRWYSSFIVSLKNAVHPAVQIRYKEHQRPLLFDPRRPWLGDRADCGSSTGAKLNRRAREDT